MAKGGESFLMNFETVQLQTSVTVNVMFSQRRTFTVIVDFFTTRHMQTVKQPTETVSTTEHFRENENIFSWRTA